MTDQSLLLQLMEKLEATQREAQRGMEDTRRRVEDSLLEQQQKTIRQLQVYNWLVLAVARLAVIVGFIALAKRR